MHQRRRVDVDQPHVGAEVAHDLGGGGEGVGGGDDLVARADAQRLEREVQAGGGRIDGQRLQRPVAEEGAEVVLEALGLGAGGEPAGAQRVDHLGDLLLADLGQGEGQDIVPADVSPNGRRRSEIVRAGPPGGLRSDPRIAPVRTKRQVEVVSHRVALSGILLQL